MNWKSLGGVWLTSLALAVALGSSAEAQQQTGAITGRATDTSGGALPGVTVSITSPNMIGGARTAVTDEQGVYRLTLLRSSPAATRSRASVRRTTSRVTSRARTSRRSCSLKASRLA